MDWGHCSTGRQAAPERLPNILPRVNMMGGLWHRMTRERISRRNLVTTPARTMEGAIQTARLVPIEVSPVHAAQLAQSWCSFWNTSSWGGRSVPAVEAAALEREWIAVADRILLERVRAELRDAVVFNSAIAQGMIAAGRLTPRAIADAGESAMQGGSVVFWSDLAGLLLVVVACE